MAKRTFGAIRAAGVRVEEQEGDKTITPGALGFAGFAMLTEKGPVGELAVATTRALFDQIFGGIIDDGQGPDNAQDYYSLANGAGGICVIRITDGNELPAELPVYARNEARVEVGVIRAANGGRWGGKEDELVSDLDDAGDLANATLQLPAAIAAAYTTDQWKDGWIELSAVPNKRYPIISNTDTGLITVTADQKMLDDWTTAAVPADLRFYLVLENETKELSVRIGDGEESPSQEFSVEVFMDGDQVKKWGNLHTNPTNNRYWVNVINNDASNYYIEVEDTFIGMHTPETRPANVFRAVASVTASTVNLEIADFLINSPVALGDPVFLLGTTTDDMLGQIITITMTAATTGTAVSDRLGPLGVVTLGTLFDPANAAGGALLNKWAPPFTVTAGGDPLVATDTLVIDYRPLKPDALAGGVVYPRYTDDPMQRYRILGNDHDTITVQGGVDLVADGVVAADNALVSYATALSGGRDGNADVTDTDFISKAWDPTNSPFNDVKGQNLGLVKFATPGVTATAVQKAGAQYAYARNHQYRIEIPEAVDTEDAALDYINNTIGRTEYTKTFFPTYGKVPDPNPAAAREGRLKTISTVGMQLGREARIVSDYQGYHKAQAGTTATLPRLLETPVGDRALDEERLNPNGINVIVKRRGNFVLWGDRTLHVDPSWKFAHQREQMSYYENVLLEEFDFIIFEINDAESDRAAETALVQFFLPEWVKRALRGATFQKAAVIKVDEELNTDLVRAGGDKIASISLQLADTTERFIIRIGKQGVFDQVA